MRGLHLGLEPELDISVKPQRVTKVERDHSKLKNRDLPDQHPMQAIAGLNSELDKKLTAGDAMSNLDILKILEA